jgi:hypothetical protein
MNSVILAVIAAVAGIFAWVLFGKPQGSDQRADDRVERVEPVTPSQEPIAPVPSSPPVETEFPTAASSEASVAETAETITEPKTPLPEIADPWADEAIADEPISSEPIAASEMVETPEPAVKPEPLVEAAELTADSKVEAVAVTMAAPARSAISAKPMNSEGAVGTSMPPFAAIHDPKRPSTPELQDLSQEILNMGASQQLRFVPKLSQYANHSDPMIRSYVAYALGQIAAPHTVKAEIESIIPVLGKLSQDSNVEVRKMALKALSAIQSPKVLPYLEKGLLSSTGSVQQLANTAIQKLKLQYEPASSDSKLPNQQFPPALQKRNQ